jgi:hypothetical protein
MSDFPIQESAPDQLAGGQQPLQPDRTSTHGHNGDVVFPLSGRTGVNVEGRNARLISPAANNRDAGIVSGLAVDSPVAVSVKPVDSKTITGSYAGDHRAKAAPAAMPANPAPRQPVGQFPNSGRTPAASTPQSFTSNADSDAGN